MPLADRCGPWKEGDGVPGVSGVSVDAGVLEASGVLSGFAVSAGVLEAAGVLSGFAVSAGA